MNPIIAYIGYALSGLVLLAVFFFIYTRLTPYKEIELLKRGNRAVAYYLSGAMLGFAATIAVSIATHSNFPSFLGWSAGALIVQIIVYLGLNKMFSDLAREIEENNTAVGALAGAVAICAGIVNAACLYS